MTPAERLFIALDCGADHAMRVVLDTLRLGVGYKIGPILLTQSEGGAVLAMLRHARARVFMDFKLRDTASVIARVIDGMAETGIHMATVFGRASALDAAVAGRGSRPNPLLLAVANLSDSTMPNGEHFLANWLGQGGDGVVLSAKDDKQTMAGTIVMPGVRLAGDHFAGGHTRTFTPAEALAFGASHLVVGRPIVQADSPREATVLYLDAIAAVIRPRPAAG